jgi:hypothetical protein
MPAVLTGAAEPVQLDIGYAVRAPGLFGVADVVAPRTGTERSRARVDADGTAALDAAFAATNVLEVRQVELHLTPPEPGVDTARSLRSGDGQPVLELEVPDLGPEAGQLVLACDETGVLTWHLPVGDDQRVQPPATRGAGGTKRFLIPATLPSPAPPEAAGRRSLLGVVGRKVLKVLVYPVTDPILGPVGEFFAERWETKHRPYGVRDFSPDNFRLADGPALTAADWERLAAGRALLFIHGTFSTAHGAFSLFPTETMRTLHQGYAGRVFAFNHFSLSHDPGQNAAWLLEQIPQDRSLDLDIVCHSRGGLVARALAEGPSSFGLDTSRLSVKRIVFAGVPNHGTLLAHPDHMVTMIDRLTTALNLFPTGAVTETLEALITAIKVIGHGVLKGLDGLASMNPEGVFLRRLNQGAPAGLTYHAIAADYEPVDQGLAALVTGSVADAVLDRVFQTVANDLVVPEPGVYGANGSGIFPIAEASVLRIPASEGVIHTTLFGYRQTADRIADWLLS